MHEQLSLVHSIERINKLEFRTSISDTFAAMSLFNYEKTVEDSGLK